jgi:hypothetical protein
MGEEKRKRRLMMDSILLIEFIIFGTTKSKNKIQWVFPSNSA